MLFVTILPYESLIERPTYQLCFEQDSNRLTFLIFLLLDYCILLPKVNTTFVIRIFLLS